MIYKWTVVLSEVSVHDRLPFSDWIIQVILVNKKRKKFQWILFIVFCIFWKSHYHFKQLNLFYLVAFIGIVEFRSIESEDWYRCKMHRKYTFCHLEKFLIEPILFCCPVIIFIFEGKCSEYVFCPFGRRKVGQILVGFPLTYNFDWKGIKHGNFRFTWRCFLLSF